MPKKVFVSGSFDLAACGCGMRESFEAQVAIFPNMQSEDMLAQIEAYHSHALGWKVAGQPIENAVRISIRRPSD